MNVACPYCGDTRTNNLPINPGPGELMCAKCNKRFDSRIIDGVIQIQKFDFKPEYAPYDKNDKDVMMKMQVDEGNRLLEFERKVDEIREQVNILLKANGSKIK